MYMVASVLIVEDDFALRSALCASLEVSGYRVKTSDSAESAIAILNKNNKFDILITDIQMGELSGIDLLKYIRKNNTTLPVILMTAYGDVSDAVEAMKLGACDYIQKPFEPEKLVSLIQSHLPNQDTCDIVIEDALSIETYAYARKIAQTDSTVLLMGPSGAGKEVMAKYIHLNSNRKEQDFVAINCAAIPENMLESTLFGYEKGAFTGAHQACPGKFEQAQDGTLLLDEISEMPVTLQAKLLRVIQEREVERLGGKKNIKLNVRIIATTNRDLKQEVEDKKFREDLFYRLNVFPINCLALAERPKDIIPLAEMFLNKYCQANAKGKKTFSPQAEAKMLAYHWPGNVRELDNFIQRIAVLSEAEVVEAEELHFHDGQPSKDTDGKNKLQSSKTGDESLLGNDMRHHEYQLIIESLSKCKGKKKAVAEQLGISARTLRYKLAKMREAGYQIPQKPSVA